MSSSDGGGTKSTLCSGSGEGAPAQEKQGPEFEGWGSVSTSGDQDKQVDMKGIHDEVWLTNMNQFFPYPAWRKVMGKLKRKADIESCSNASPFFGNFLHEKREKEVVLPTVFGILARKYSDGNKHKDESYKETNVESIPWKSRRKEPHRMTGLWKCRLVCKKWNEVIEDLYQNEAAGHYQMDDEWNSAENEKLGIDWRIEVFAGESNADNFLAHFQPTHFDAVRLGRVLKKCPFWARAVNVSCDRDIVENQQDYCNRLVEFFHKFGDQVWYFKFWCEYTREFVNFYQILKQTLILMPNLKALHIWYHSRNYLDGPPACEDEILRNPLSEGTNMEMICVDGIPGPLCNHLVNQNRQISQLKIVDIDFPGNCAFFTEKLPNLNQLSLKNVNMLEFLETFERYPAILNLKSLKLWDLKPQFSHPFVPWSRFFNAIGSKVNSDTCTDLQLEMPFPDSDDQIMSVWRDSQECRLPLANIQRCKIHSIYAFSLDFLLPSKNSLMEMDIRTWCSIPKLWEKQVIKFVGCEDKMVESNIAKELPALRKLIVYTRQFGPGRHYSIQPNGVVQLDI